ncbi:MAG: hypothetical protein JWP91_4044 [Fibrobacteres bacterium]|nr:hypothetical protein [Fibrobacterota bacterium]
MLRISGFGPGRTALSGLLLIAAVLAVLRGVAPIWIRRHINDRPASVNGYKWDVADVDLRLLRLAYDLEGVTLRKEGLAVPVFRSGKMTSTIRFKSLFHGPVLADAEAFHPELNLTLNPGKRRSKKPLDWARLLHRLTLFRLSGFTIHQGEVHIRDLSESPPVELSAEDVHIEAEHLFRGGADSSEWAGLKSDGLFMGSGRFVLDTRLRPESGTPVFEIDFTLKGMDLKAMSRAVEAYAGMAVEKGRLDLDVRARASGGRYKGQVHSKLHDFGLMKMPGKDKSFAKALEEKAARVAGRILEWKTEKNEAEGKGPPKLDFSGEFPAEVTDSWSMSEYVLKEAFRKGLKP